MVSLEGELYVQEYHLIMEKKHIPMNYDWDSITWQHTWIEIPDSTNLLLYIFIQFKKSISLNGYVGSSIPRPKAIGFDKRPDWNDEAWVCKIGLFFLIFLQFFAPAKNFTFAAHLHKYMPRIFNGLLNKYLQLNTYLNMQGSFLVKVFLLRTVFLVFLTFEI